MKSAAELKSFADGFFGRCAEADLSDNSVSYVVKAASAMSEDVAAALALRPFRVQPGNLLEFVKRSVDMARADEGAAVDTASIPPMGPRRALREKLTEDATRLTAKDKKLRETHPESRANLSQRVVSEFLNPTGDLKGLAGGFSAKSAAEFLRGQLLKCAVTPHSPLAAPQPGPSLPFGPGPGSGPQAPNPDMFTTLGRSIFPKQPAAGKPQAQGEAQAQPAAEAAPEPTGKFRKHVTTLAAKLNPTSHRDNVTALASTAVEPKSAGRMEGNAAGGMRAQKQNFTGIAKAPATAPAVTNAAPVVAKAPMKARPLG